MTVLGPVAADELGVTLPHEHVFINQVREYRGTGLLNDHALAVQELARFRDHDGRSSIARPLNCNGTRSRSSGSRARAGLTS
jgi:phosphotriesterase-related protein